MQRPGPKYGKDALILLIAVALLVSGCATETPKPRLQPRYFETIAIVSPNEFTEWVKPETQMEKALEGASVGAGSTGLGAMAVGRHRARQFHRVDRARLTNLGHEFGLQRAAVQETRQILTEFTGGRITSRRDLFQTLQADGGQIRTHHWV